MNSKLTLSELNGQIRDALTDAFPSTVWVVAEVSELKENRSGHGYLELIEKSENEIVARARATIWSYTFRMLKPYFETTTGRPFSAGIKILVQVTVEYHPAFGLSLNIKDIDPAFTIGDLALQRRQIIERLQKEGVFDMNRELGLPFVPQKIAIISSKTAAGYQDFMNHLETNPNGFRFYTRLFEATMQGSEAVPSIIHSLERIFQYEDFFDAVAIIRGGGAAADLGCFDNYELAFHITQFPLPVVTGIGHEKDDTIIDLVAHTRMKTPTAVAEFFIAGMERFYEKMMELEESVVRLTAETLEWQQKKLEKTADRLYRLSSGFVSEKSAGLNRMGNALQKNVNGFIFLKNYNLVSVKHRMFSTFSIWKVETKNGLEQKKRRLRRTSGESVIRENALLNKLIDILKNNFGMRLLKEKERIHYNENTVRLLSPENVLNRGYTLTLYGGKIMKSAEYLELNDEIDTRFTDGTVKSKIIKKEKNGQ